MGAQASWHLSQLWHLSQPSPSQLLSLSLPPLQRRTPVALQLLSPLPALPGRVCQTLAGTGTLSASSSQGSSLLFSLFCYRAWVSWLCVSRWSFRLLRFLRLFCFFRSLRCSGCSRSRWYSHFRCWSVSAVFSSLCGYAFSTPWSRCRGRCCSCRRCCCRRCCCCCRTAHS